MTRCGLLIVCITRKHSELSELNVKVMEALSLYAKLMNEDPVYAMYAKLQSQQYYMQQPASAAQQVKSIQSFFFLNLSSSYILKVEREVPTLGSLRSLEKKERDYYEPE